MNRKGIATILGFVVILVLAILASAMLMRSVGGNRRTEIFVDQNRAFWSAEGGAARAIWELNKGGGTWTGWTMNGNDATFQGSLGAAGDYDITVYDYANSTVQVEATGFFPNRTATSPIRRTIEVIATKVSTSLFEYAAYSENKLSMSGQGSTDSYDSALGAYGGANVGTNGDVGSNTEVEPSGGNTYIDGDVTIPVGGTVPNAQYYSGSVVEEDKPALELVSVPASLSSLSNDGWISSTQTISSGDYKYTGINLSSQTTVTITGPVNIYLTGATAISITGQAEVIIDSASTGPVNIYFDGDVNLAGQGITNETSIPSNLILYGTNATSQTVDISGQTDFYGAFYAPTSEMNLVGQGGLYGAFVGSEVTISGQGGVHYDEQLGSAGAGAVTQYQITSFRDTQTPYSLSP